MVDLAQTITEWKDVEGNKVTLKKTFYEKMLQLRKTFLFSQDDDQYLGDICFSLRYVPTSGKVNSSIFALSIPVKS